MDTFVPGSIQDTMHAMHQPDSLWPNPCVFRYNTGTIGTPNQPVVSITIQHVV